MDISAIMTSVAMVLAIDPYYESRHTSGSETSVGYTLLSEIYMCTGEVQVDKKTSLCTVLALDLETLSLASSRSCIHDPRDHRAAYQ